MRISFSTGTFYHRGLDYSLRLAREVGFDGVEAVLGMNYVRHGPQPLARAARSREVPILSIHPPFFPLPGWPRASIERIPRATEAARQLGASVCVIHTVFLYGERGPRADRYSAGLRLGLEAGAGQVAIGIESNQYFGRTRRYLLDDLAALARFAAERGCGITFDTCHAGANGEDLLACYEIVRPYLVNVHLSDVRWQNGKPHTHILPGEGVLPLHALLGAMAADGYDGLVTMEIHPTEMGLFGRPRHVRRLRQALDFVRAAIAQPNAAPAPSTSQP